MAVVILLGVTECVHTLGSSAIVLMYDYLSGTLFERVITFLACMCVRTDKQQ